ncbi:MAG TPA: hypothetical protein V6D10_05765 [Trichocoleus sp.]|jgi:hypothetical protein
MNGNERQLPQLTDRLEWNLVRRQLYEGQEVVSGARRRISYYIPPQTFLIDSNVIAIGMKNDRAPASWYLGGWATQRLSFTPSSTSEFQPSVVANRRSLRLGVLNLWILPKLDRPWFLEVQIPRWHQRMLVEIWRYDGIDIDQFQRFNDLEVQIESFADAFDGGV